MKKLLIVIMLFFSTLMVGCGQTDYNLTESSYFLVLTHMQLYPERYVDKDMSMDCFTYILTDVDGNEYLCGVRKCSAGYGCRCGRDTIIGFILEYDGTIPEPKNQSVDTNDKAWIHITGQVKDANFKEITIYAYDQDGNIDYDGAREVVKFLTFKVSSLDVVEDYSNLNYYVS